MSKISIKCIHDRTCKFIRLWFASKQVGAVHKSQVPAIPKASTKWHEKAPNSQEMNNPKMVWERWPQTAEKWSAKPALRCFQEAKNNRKPFRNSLGEPQSKPRNGSGEPQNGPQTAPKAAQKWSGSQQLSLSQPRNVSGEPQNRPKLSSKCLRETQTAA